MIRRWLIRVPCLVALALVVSAWVTSYFGTVGVGIQLENYSEIVLAVQGRVLLASKYLLDPDYRGIWYFKRGETARDWTINATQFEWRDHAFPAIPASVIVFPLWLPTGLLAGLNWFVWRKTRATYNGRGFPVEVGKKAEG